jgi:ketosteroid isomerase-like protein
MVDMATADGVRVWLAGFGDQPFDYEVADLAVVVGGDVAFAHALGRMGSPGGFSLWFRFTVGLRKSQRTWQIAHLHASVPFYMDETRRAALDLTP